MTSTLDEHEAARTVWQVVVVGAGPAGALAARELAMHGRDVLLVDKASFPRRKVCGGCLGSTAVKLLEDCGLDDLLVRLAAPPTTGLRLYAGGRRADLPLSGGVAVSREAFDTALIQSAIDAGAQFLDRAAARLDPPSDDHRRLQVRRGECVVPLTARLVLAADGLAGTLLAGQQEWTARVAARSRIGLGVAVDDPQATFEPGIISMVHAPGGYLGLVRLEDGRLNAAAAFDAEYLREAGSPAAAAARHLERAGLPWPSGLETDAWVGTPTLTRRRPRLAAHRLLLVGDATGYIEPFTGEGMTWALLSARAVVPTALEGIDAWVPDLGRHWQARHRRLIGRRQWVCRLVTSLLQRPAATRAVVRLLERFPSLAHPALHAVSRPCRVT